MWSRQFKHNQCIGKSSFALDNAKRRSVQYLKDTNQTEQMPNIPDTYPTQTGILAALDIAVRAKILKAHLEDAFVSNRFSIKITRRKKHPVLSITHDSLETDAVNKIARLYTDDTTKLVMTKKIPGNPPDDPVRIQAMIVM